MQPKVVVPSAAPPKTMVSHDLIVGHGPAAADGDTVSVKYVGVTYSTKQIFSQSWSPYQPFSFVLGAHQVIPGWDTGVVGMKAGGRRELIIPPSMGYGASPPAGSGIPVNATLIFIVDVLKVTTAQG